jgi:hypothetical protein
MESDAQRADPLLEGAPVGVFISKRDDPSTFLNFCAGQGEPLIDPDAMADRRMGEGHYTGCPIWAAAQEMNELDSYLKQRLFAPEKRPEVDAEVAGGYVGPEEVTLEDPELQWLLGERVL